jgi:hypothetical protein
MNEKQLLVKDVLKWAIKEFGYYGHLTELAKIIGMKRGYFNRLRERSQWVPARHTETLIKASNGKLKPVDKK